MGQEGPIKPDQSIDDVLANLNAGTIEAGEKNIENVTTPDGFEVRHQPEFSTIFFEIENIEAEVSLQSKAVELKEIISGKRVHNAELERQVRFLAQHWDEMGLFETRQ